MCSSSDLKFWLGNEFTFAGVFRTNELSSLKSKINIKIPIKIIVNIEFEDNYGHFIGLICLHDICLYFDPLNRKKINKKIKRFLKNNFIKIYFNKKRVQSYNSLNCGKFCAYFIANVNNSFQYNLFLKQFNINYKLNDFIVNCKFY